MIRFAAFALFLALSLKIASHFFLNLLICECRSKVVFSWITQYKINISLFWPISIFGWPHTPKMLLDEWAEHRDAALSHLKIKSCMPEDGSCGVRLLKVINLRIKGPSYLVCLSIFCCLVLSTTNRGHLRTHRPVHHTQTHWQVLIDLMSVFLNGRKPKHLEKSHKYYTQNREIKATSFSQWGHGVAASHGFVGWTEWAEYEKDDTLARPRQQPRDTSARQETDKRATRHNQHVSLYHCSGRKPFPFPSPAAPPKSNACLLESKNPGSHRRSRPRTKARNKRQAHLCQLVFLLMKARPAWLICLFASLIVS